MPACAAMSTISSLGPVAYTSTAAPAAASNSAFHAAAALPPAITTRLPPSAKNTGKRASGSMRGVRASDGVRVMDDPLQFRQARAAVRAGAQRLADGLDIRGTLRRDGIAD